MINLFLNKLPRYYSLALLFIFVHFYARAQQTLQPQQAQAQVYPRITGYIGIVHPLVAFSSSGTQANFNGSYTVGFPAGINIWKTAKTGFSFEAVPYIRAENGSSKMSNFLFHPGVLLALGNGFNFVGRAAFETSGRYGVTPIFTKVIKKNKNSNYFIALPLPARFGNSKPAAFGAAFQIALGF